MKQIQDASGNKYIGFGRNENRNGKRVFVLTALLSKTTSDVLNMTVPQTETIIEEDIDPNCTLCNKDYWICLIDKKATYSFKATALNKICLEIPKAKSDALCQELYGYEVAEINAFLEDLLSNSTLGENVGNLTPTILATWHYLYTKQATNAENARKDWNTLVQFGKLNDNVKAEIVQLTDNSSTDSRIKQFCADMANTQGFVAFLNDVDNFYIVESFLGYRKDYTSEKYEEIEEDFDLITDLTIKEKVINWHNHAVTASKRKGKYAEGKEFENWITIHLGSSESPTYRALKTAFATDGWNLDDYSIYRQVQMCINGQTTCNGKKDYFIADFVFVKEVVDPVNGNYLDVKVADTKLSASTDFTKNQKESKLKNTLFIKSDNPSRIKGGSISLFNKPNFFTNSKIIYKIYSGGSTTTYGGITK